MKITREDDFGGAVLNCAVRYCLGRATYMPALVMDEITPMLADCSTKTLRVFDQDVAEWLDEKDVDAYAYDRMRWERFLQAVRAELAQREEQ